MTIMFKTSVQSMGNIRNYSTNVPSREKIDNFYLAKNVAAPINFQGFYNKTFNVLKPNVYKGQILQSCSDFIKKVNSYPNNLRKEHIEEPSKFQSSEALSTETLGVYPNNFRRIIDYSSGSVCDGESGKIETPKSTSWVIFNRENSTEIVEKMLFGKVIKEEELGKVEDQKSRSFEKDMGKAGNSDVDEERCQKSCAVKIGKYFGSPQVKKIFSTMLESKRAESFPPMAEKPSSRTKTRKDHQTKRTKEPKKRKQRQLWHKSLIDLDFDVDLEVEVAVEAVDYIPEPPQRESTLEEFIKKSKPIQCQPQTTFIKDILSPLCLNFSTPVYFSVSPPRPEIFRENIVQRNCVFRKRFPSDCPSEDSISIIFGDINDDTRSTDDFLFDDYSDDSDDEFADDESDLVDGCCHSYDFINFNKKSNKKVRFDDKVTVHPMITWAYAYRASRKGPWEQCVRDRERFKKRVDDSSKTLDKILESQHRERIYKERFQMEEDCVQVR